MKRRFTDAAAPVIPTVIAEEPVRTDCARFPASTVPVAVAASDGDVTEKAMSASGAALIAVESVVTVRVLTPKPPRVPCGVIVTT